MKKQIDLSETCVKTLSKRAIDENTKFKLLAQKILEKEAEKIPIIRSNNFNLPDGGIIFNGTSLIENLDYKIENGILMFSDPIQERLKNSYKTTIKN